MKGGCVSLFILVLSIVSSKNAADNVAHHPGHLLPFGDPSAGPRLPVAQLSVFPSPVSFVNDYVLPSRPLLLKGVYKSSPAFTLWDDEYFRTVYEPPDSSVNVETTKKEDRNQKMVEISFKDFVAVYRKQSVYMVDQVPHHLQRDVSIPFCLQCPGLARLFRRNLMWMSSGGTKSVVHIDDFENLNCLVRGEKQLVLVDRKKYPKAVPLDRSAETFSSLDVDSVDYVKYPTMANVGEYHLANMTAGDCLYIPFKWIHQVRSYNQNIAVNLWWDHVGTKALDLDKCERDSTSDWDLTLRSIDWDANTELDDQGQSFQSALYDIVADDEHLTFTLLFSMFFDDNFTGKSRFLDLPPSYEVRGREWLKSLFSQLDLDSDGSVAMEELDSLTDAQWDKIEATEMEISKWIEEAVNGKNKDEL